MQRNKLQCLKLYAGSTGRTDQAALRGEGGGKYDIMPTRPNLGMTLEITKKQSNKAEKDKRISVVLFVLMFPDQKAARNR